MADLPSMLKGREFSFSLGQLITLVLPQRESWLDSCPLFSILYAEEKGHSCLPPLGAIIRIPVNELSTENTRRDNVLDSDNQV